MNLGIRRKISTFILALLALVVLGSLSADAAPGSLDPTFGSDGKVTDWLSRGDDIGSGVVAQPDGKVVVAGTSWTGLNNDFALVRYNADGSLDTTFGNGGRVTTDLASGYDAAYSVAIQPDGRIVVAGSSWNGQKNVFALARYTISGSLDPTFGGGGTIRTNFGSSSASAYSVAVHTDGKIVAAGSSYNNLGRWDFALARYNADGSLDTSFDSDGMVTTVFTANENIAYAVAIQADGKIVAAGQSYNPMSFGFVSTIVRYSVNGTLDTSFAGSGILTAANSRWTRSNAVAVQADGKIVAAGSEFLNGSNSNFIVARYNPDGSSDAVGGTNATLFPGVLQWAFGQSVAFQPDGKILVAGMASGIGTGSYFAIARFDSTLLRDTTFGTYGVVVTLIGSTTGAQSVAVQPDGRIIAAGSGGIASDQDFAVVRYKTDGSLDPGFDTDGKVTTDLGFFQGNALRATAIQPDGKIVAVGNVRDDFAVVRYNSDGSSDVTFGSGTGKVRTDMGSTGDTARAVVIQPDGKILVAGGSYDWDDNQCCFALARYDTDGSLDSTFSGDGKVITGPLGTYGDGAFDVAIQSDGKIVVAGNVSGLFAVYRYNADGSLDSSWDGDGKATTQIEGGSSGATSVAIQSDGKIVAAGFNAHLSFAVVRYNENGSLDTSFDGDGVVTTHIDSDDYAQDVALQSDGKIVVAGCTSSLYDFNCDQFAIARFNMNGSLDTTFDSDGKVTTKIFGSLQDTFLNSVAIQRNGQIVAAGYAHNGSNFDFVLARFSPNGSLDTTFGGGDGVSTADFSNSIDNAYGMALDNAGRAVVVGESNGQFAMARFLVAGGSTPFDFDGDGRSDISVFRPSDRYWYVNASQAGFYGTQFGLSSDKLIPADYDGDGKTDIAVLRGGDWYWLNSSNGSFQSRQFGQSGDVPVPFDYTGDGRAELAVYRSGFWYTWDLANSRFQGVQFGIPTDWPVPADYS